jgi:hypothetical protein
MTHPYAIAAYITGCWCWILLNLQNPHHDKGYWTIEPPLILQIPSTIPTRHIPKHINVSNYVKLCSVTSLKTLAMSFETQIYVIRNALLCHSKRTHYLKRNRTSFETRCWQKWNLQMLTEVRCETYWFDCYECQCRSSLMVKVLTLHKTNE